ncbi:hypothetical protein COX27_00215 [Candidatus Kuenenbacteria bacterium CG23_combo_of_CG06-09_8_20_14_all_36_9]|uniref:Cytosolic protein n=1 Tax=Candidatus Kuenenbacteria bacterium CG10_big_fil_rev_8_21_14_0_10_36_11 TaxID=1974618 RepID=A0A2M6WAD5_9BACT|nr:MAG: hypothetical protein COX27_00215 [Candidatus Kuenenbacteria bacterium CG23_combo_of_CG06-09_8_20_14_all_36_9]PIT89711.1 MAG: hypothetical protein COU23_02405 [Candidatus Kuenenbacteria bacterium CG10_big_fil_rev_8_21_14_0_10_36_11]
MLCQIQKNLKKCNCTYEFCPRKGRCCLCVAYHQKRHELPACYFDAKKEKTYDRSLENYLV